jgi:hypothetical protein
LDRDAYWGRDNDTRHVTVSRDEEYIRAQTIYGDRTKVGKDCVVTVPKRYFPDAANKAAKVQRKVGESRPEAELFRYNEPIHWVATRSMMREQMKRVWLLTTKQWVELCSGSPAPTTVPADD